MQIDYLSDCLLPAIMPQEALQQSDENRGQTPRRRLQLRLSTLFFVVLVMALVCGWWTDHSRLSKRLQLQNQQIKIFSLVNGNADELARVVREMFQEDATASFKVTSDSRTNSIIVRGSPDKLSVIEATLLRLDQ